MSAEVWLEQHAIRCRRWEMRISPDTCGRYQQEWPLRCDGCERMTLDAKAATKRKVNIHIAKRTPMNPAGPKKRSEKVQPEQDKVMISFAGDDALIVKRLLAKSAADGHDPAQDIATILGLFLDGKLRLRS